MSPTARRLLYWDLLPGVFLAAVACAFSRVFSIGFDWIVLLMTYLQREADEVSFFIATTTRQGEAMI